MYNEDLFIDVKLSVVIVTLHEMFDRLVKEESVDPKWSSNLFNILQANLVGKNLLFLNRNRLWNRLNFGFLFFLNGLSFHLLFVPEAGGVFGVNFLEEVLPFGFSLLLGRLLNGFKLILCQCFEIRVFWLILFIASGWRRFQKDILCWLGRLRFLF